MSDDPYKALGKQSSQSNWRISNLRFWLYFLVFGVGGSILTLAVIFTVIGLLMWGQID